MDAVNQTGAGGEQGRLGVGPDNWRSAALRLGEELSKTGPDGYYGFTPQQWLTWALEHLASTPEAVASPEVQQIRERLAAGKYQYRADICCEGVESAEGAIRFLLAYAPVSEAMPQSSTPEAVASPRVCVCGHDRGQHFAEPEGSDCKKCGCDLFRLAPPSSAPAPSCGVVIDGVGGCRCDCVNCASGNHADCYYEPRTCPAPAPGTPIETKDGNYCPTCYHPCDKCSHCDTAAPGTPEPSEATGQEPPDAWLAEAIEDGRLTPLFVSGKTAAYVHELRAILTDGMDDRILAGVTAAAFAAPPAADPQALLKDVPRYDLITNYRCGSSIEEMERADDGEWARFDDLLAALTRTEDQR